MNKILFNYIYLTNYYIQYYINIESNTTIAEVEEHWTRLQKINPNNPKALRMYGDFLMEILNDREGGQELISRAKDNVASRTAAVPNFYDSANSGNNVADLWMSLGGSDGSPCIIASGEQNRMGEIIQINMGMCRIFGYTKNEMLGKKLDLLMPSIYSKSHDGFIRNSLTRAEESAQNEDKTGKAGDRNTNGRLVLGKHKSTFLIPLWLETRIFSLVSQGSLIGATFKQEKKNYSATYLLLDTNRDIVGVSSLAVSSLNITKSMVKDYRIPISILSPHLFDPDNLAQYRSKDGGIAVIALPDRSKDDETKTDPSHRRGAKDKEEKEEEKEEIELL